MFGGGQRYGNAAREDYRLRWPETGGVRVLLEAALVYHLVAVATPLLVEQIAALNPTIVPQPFTTVLYAFLWIGIGAVVAWLFLSESLVRTRRFDEYDAVEVYLERESPARRWFLRNGGLVVFGGVLAGVTYEGFVVAFLRVVDLLVIVEEFEWALTVADGLYIVGFLGGFLLFATGVDRLAVGGLRWYVRRRHESR